jgi:hypothetical protein
MSRLLPILLLAVSFAPSWLRAASLPAVAEVVAIHPGRVADLVLLNRGSDAGLREGMVCRLSRGSSEVAELLIVDLRPGCGAALILSVSPRQALRPGDSASIKLLKS